MSDPARILGVVCGNCCLVIASTATSLCSLRPFGFDKACCSDHGCCGCCCRDSFDEEHFDKQMQREMERTRDKRVYTLVKPMEMGSEYTDSVNAGSSLSRARLELTGKVKDGGDPVSA